MAKYIPLDAVLAEIEKIIADETESIKCFERRRNVSEVQRSNARIGVLTHLRSLLDTLEVKEVDLEKEIEKYAYSLPHSATGATIYVSDIKSPIAREFGIKHDWSYEYVEQIAEHFFELGLKAQKGE